MKKQQLSAEQKRLEKDNVQMRCTNVTSSYM